ncbi:MAG: hypothetical protein WCX65_12165 [bacterium]
MRKGLIYAVLVLSAVLLPAFAHASGSTAAKAPKYAVSLNYWDANLIKSFPTFSEKSGQTFFPVILGSARLGDSKWSALGEWGKSDFSPVTSLVRPNMKEKASRTVIGMRYDPQPGFYFTLSYPIMKLNIENSVSGSTTTAAITGMQLGAGFGAYLKPPHITAGLEVNMVPDMSAKYTAGALSGKAKGPGFDVKSTVAYKFDSGSAAYIGFRWMSLQAGAVTLGNYPMPKVNFTLRGPFMGYKHVF